MKKLVLFVFLLITCLISFAQKPIKFRMSASLMNDAPDTVKLNTQGTLLKKGQTFNVWVSADGNGNTTTRQLLMDFQFPNNALQLIGITNTGTGGNGGVLPQGSNAQESYYEYPGYTYVNNTANSTSNGTTNYQNAGYNFVQNGPNTILRYNITWSGTNGMPYTGYWGMIKLTFKVKDSLVGFAINPVKLNFVAGWTGQGAWDATFQENPLRIHPYLNPNADSYVNAKIDINANLTAVAPMKILFIDSAANIGHQFDVTSTGQINVDQTKLKENTVYKVMAMVSMDKLYQLYNTAVTVSDFTGPQSEFVKTGLDGTPANINMTTGASYLAADMNNDKVFNGGDLPLLLSAAISQDTLIKLPQGYVQGSNGYMSVWTFRDTAFNNMTPSSWKNVDLNRPVTFRTGKIGDYLPLNLDYLLWGDVNRSHSSQVYNSAGTVITNALPSLMTSGRISLDASAGVGGFINTTQEIPSVEVSLSNATVTSNTVSIPVNVDTKDLSISALQFEFSYDPTKIKFEELNLGLPNTWYTFVNSKEGKVKFGALDKSLTTSPLKGKATPFTLKFSTLVSGVDILTSVKVTPTMDASDVNGNQVGIILNTTQIKLTGYNNF